jgi:hypothetical protein
MFSPLRTLSLSAVCRRGTMIVAAMAFSVSGLFGQSASELLSEAQRLYLRGDLSAAREKFELVRRMEPSNRVAIGHLKLIATALEKAQAENTVESKLAGIKLEKVNLVDATFPDAIEYIRQLTDKAANGKIKLNVVNFAPPSTTEKVRLTLTLSDIPVVEVFRFIGELADLSVSYDAYAVILREKGSGAAKAANPTTR